MSPTGLFRELEPPAGGASRLAQALATGDRARRAPGVPMALATAAGVLVVAWFAIRSPAPAAAGAEARAAVESVLRPPMAGFEPRSARIVEQPATPAGVRFYLLAREEAGDG